MTWIERKPVLACTPDAHGVRAPVAHENLSPARITASLEGRSSANGRICMTTEEFSFEHEGTFAKGELTGNLKLGKFEVHYEEIFAEVIEDGIITPEERARLDKAADALGLDRQRLRKLEVALQAAYEARHHVRVREIADETPEPASIVVRPEAAKDPRMLELEVQVAKLVARVAELEKDL